MSFVAKPVLKFPICTSSLYFSAALILLSASICAAQTPREDLINRANHLLKTGKAQDGLKVAALAIRMDPNRADGYVARAFAFHQLDQFEQSLGDFNKAEKLDKESMSSTAYEFRSDCYLNLDLKMQALRDLNLAVDKQLATEKLPNGVLYRKLGDLYCELGQYPKAIENLNKAVALRSKDYWVFKDRGDIYMKMTQYAKAAQDYGSVIKLVPQEPIGYVGRAKAYAKLGMKEKSKQDFAAAEENSVGIFGK